MEVTQFADPVKVGPGVWFSLHLTALHATTDELKRAFMIYVENLCANFRCQDCQKHFRKYLDDHPLLPYWDRKDGHGRPLGMFIWAWEFHNAVNRFLHKYEPTLEEAYDYYHNNLIGVCTDCGHSSGVSGMSVANGVSASGMSVANGVSASGMSVASANVSTVSNGSVPNERIPSLVHAYRAKQIKPQPFKVRK
jgi:Erv1 / Alr family